MHPSAFVRALDGECINLLHLCCQRIAEAYDVLAHPGTRASYDVALQELDEERFQLEETLPPAGRTGEFSAPTTAELSGREVHSVVQAEEFYRDARFDLEDQKYDSALSNAKLAVAYNPSAVRYRALLEQVRREMLEKEKS